MLLLRLSLSDFSVVFVTVGFRLHRQWNHGGAWLLLSCEGERARYETLVFDVSIFNRAILFPLGLHSPQTMFLN